MKRAVVVTLACLLSLAGLTASPVSAVESAGVQVEQTPKIFYPLVQDGYLDSTTTTVTTSQSAQVAIEVMTASGESIWSRGPVNVGYYDPGWADDGGDVEWTWNGRNSAGKIMSVGTYTVYVNATPNNGEPAITDTTTVRIARGTRWIKGKTKIPGGSFYASKATGKCKVDKRRAHIACRGRGYAQLDWRVKLGKVKIRDLSGEMWGYWAPATRVGETHLWFTRDSKYAYAHVRVTKWQYATISSVIYKYEYSTKI